MTQLDDVVLAAYPRLSEWITPMGDLVNRNQSYSWLAPTYSLVKARITTLYSESPHVLKRAVSV